MGFNYDKTQFHLCYGIATLLIEGTLTLHDNQANNMTPGNLPWKRIAAEIRDLKRLAKTWCSLVCRKYLKRKLSKCNNIWNVRIFCTLRNNAPFSKATLNIKSSSSSGSKDGKELFSAASFVKLQFLNNQSSSSSMLSSRQWPDFTIRQAQF